MGVERPETAVEWEKGVAVAGHNSDGRLGLFQVAAAPVSGPNGTLAGVALAGALLVDTAARKLYQNTGSDAAPTWTERT